jgi:hypothetical protein
LTKCYAEGTLWWGLMQNLRNLMTTAFQKKVFSFILAARQTKTFPFELVNILTLGSPK